MINFITRYKPRFLVAVLALAIASSTAATAQDSFELKGEISNPEFEGGSTMLSYHDGIKLRFDTSRVRNGSFKFSGTVKKTMKVFLFVGYNKKSKEGKFGETQQFYLSGGNTTVKGEHILNADITGGAAQQDFNQLKQNMSKEGANAEQVNMEFVLKNPGSVVSLDLMKDMSNPNFFASRYKEMKSLFAVLPKEWQSSDDGKKVVKLLEGAKKLGVGKMAMDFTMNDINGRSVKLSDYRGKYVLLDFWASWCIPCRAENPTVVKAYEQYKGRNFTVLGVSLDKESAKKEWLAAIEKDGLPWTHVSDLKGWENIAARAYDVQSIPVNYLIDPKGKIVAVGLRGEKLLKELEALL